jgi:hypothetical protein
MLVEKNPKGKQRNKTRRDKSKKIPKRFLKIIQRTK